MKRSLNILILTLISIFGCKNDLPNSLDNQLVGEWVLDSISGSFKKWNKDFVYITHNGGFWKFTYWNDRYLIDSCLQIMGNEVLKEGKLLYHIQLLDSINLTVTDRNNNSFFYKNSDIYWRSDYEKELQEFILRDSTHQKINGWWKLTNASYKPFRLVNYADELSDFTMYLNKNGQATIFIDNLADSTIDYLWKARSEGISFERLCVVGINAPIFYFDNTKLVTSFDKWQIDTFSFEKCDPLIK